MANRDNYSELLRSVSISDWNTLSHKKIFFGHQSVGYNILDGMNEFIRENREIQLKIVETIDAEALNGGIIAHSRVGRNTDPESKIYDFERLLAGGLGDKVDIAFFKLCYVDIDVNTDVRKVFDTYVRTLQRLGVKYPHIRFIHVTVPLCSCEPKWKTYVKKMIGRESSPQNESNIRRNEYNELLRNEYLGKEAVFDLAETESIYPDGRRSTFTFSGREYSCLVQGYTDDGGHLNETGRKKVASKLLITLIRLR